MLKPIALFINGVFKSVLEEILETQSALPEQILFLQPYSGRVIQKLRDDTPSLESPMRLFLSITDDLAAIHYQAEIVGWQDKRDLSQDEKQSINRVIAALQKGERELYNDAPSSTGKNVNLLHIRRLQRVSSPFSVARLRKVNGGETLSTARTTSGGYAYVEPEVLEFAASS